MQLTLKQQIAQGFSEAADRYYSLACIQNELACIAKRAMPDINGSILDIGCATGEHTQSLGKSVVGLDLAHGMVRDAKRRSPQGSWINGDMDALPFANSSFEHVFSSMAMQWTQHPSIVLNQVFRVLKNTGTGVVLTPVEGSFWQLAHAYERSALQSRLNPLFESSVWLTSAEQLGFKITDSQVVTLTDARSSLPELLRTISKIGAASTLTDAPKLNKSHLFALKSHYPVSPRGYELDYRCLLLKLEK